MRRRSAASARRSKASLDVLQRRFPEIMAWAGFPGKISQSEPGAFPKDQKPSHLMYFFDYAIWLRQASTRQVNSELERARAGDCGTDMPRPIANLMLEFRRGMSAAELEYFRTELKKGPLKPGQIQRIAAEERRNAKLADSAAVEESKKRVSAAETRAKIAEAEVADLKRKLEASNLARAEADVLNPKLTVTYQKLVLGMALDKFQYRPGRHNSAAENIRNALLRHGLSLDAKTIRSRLAEASAALGDDI